MMIRQRWYFEGNVQGVGFRVSVKAISERYDVRGFVRNEQDGRVKVEVQGSRAELDAFRSAIERAFDFRIDHVTAVEISAQSMQDQEKGFSILY